MSLITTEHTENVLIIRLNRPDKMNAFTEPMAQLLQEALDKAASHDEVRALVLTGNGKAFCAGQDLHEVTNKGADHTLGETVRTSYNPIIKAIRRLEKPVVCAVNGTAAGAGANIAFACDIVLAATNALFVQSFSNIGLIPDSGGTFFLPRLVGLQRTNSMYLLNEKIAPDQAVAMGLIYKVFSPDDLFTETQIIARKLASMPTKGFGLYKRAVNKSFSNDLDTQLELEADLQTQAGATSDYREGVQAFLEKRKPGFEGR